MSSRMKILSEPAQLREQVAAWRRDGLRVGFVPTMGNLHPGHLSLMAQCRGVADRVVSSIFVNPLQFGPGEDYDSYPRTLDADSAVLQQAGVDLLFTPATSVIYPGDPDGRTRIHVPALETLLCGVTRPHFFSGVATVVNLLFNLVGPDVAIFGEKDYQQLLVIRRMVADLHIPVEVLGGAIVREADGLAMSSRNAYLSDAERRQAPALHQALLLAAERLRAGDTFADAERAGGGRIAEAGLDLDYFSIRRATDLRPVQAGDRDLRVLAAARLGRARLIDNIGIHLAEPDSSMKRNRQD